MSAPDPRVTAHTTATAGRYILSARSNHFIADASAGRGGPEEAIGAAELYLAALSACGLALVTEAARASNIDDTNIGVESAYRVDAEDRTRFEWVSITFSFPGLNKATAETLVKSFTDICPIYNTVARDTRVDVTARV